MSNALVTDEQMKVLRGLKSVSALRPAPPAARYFSLPGIRGTRSIGRGRSRERSTRQGLRGPLPGSVNNAARRGRGWTEGVGGMEVAPWVARGAGAGSAVGPEPWQLAGQRPAAVMEGGGGIAPASARRAEGPVTARARTGGRSATEVRRVRRLQADGGRPGGPDIASGVRRAMVEGLGGERFKLYRQMWIDMNR